MWGISGNPTYMAQNDPHDTLITLSRISWRSFFQIFCSGLLCSLKSEPLPVLGLPFYKGSVI